MKDVDCAAKVRALIAELNDIVKAAYERGLLIELVIWDWREGNSSVAVKKIWREEIFK